LFSWLFISSWLFYFKNAAKPIAEEIKVYGREFREDEPEFRAMNRKGLKTLMVFAASVPSCYPDHRKLAKYLHTFREFMLP